MIIGLYACLALVDEYRTDTFVAARLQRQFRRYDKSNSGSLLREHRNKLQGTARTDSKVPPRARVPIRSRMVCTDARESASGIGGSRQCGGASGNPPHPR